MTTEPSRLAADPSKGYEAAAHEFIERRRVSRVGVQTVLAWAQLRRGYWETP